MPKQLTELLNLVTNIPDIEDKFQFITKLGHAYCLSPELIFRLLNLSFKIISGY